MPTMFDSVNPNQLPPGADAYAGYVNGRYADYATIVAREPGKPVLSIAVSATADAHCLDIESGDATNGQAAAWVLRQVSLGVVRPWVYTQVSNAAALVSALAAAGLTRGRYYLWTAHYTGVSHQCSSVCYSGFPGLADGTQWLGNGPQGDVSLITTQFLAALSGVPLTPVVVTAPIRLPSPGEKMTPYAMQVLMSGSNGWAEVPAGLTAANVVSVVPADTDPTVTGYNPNVPTFKGLSAAGQMIFVGPVVDGIYGFTLWAAMPAAA